MPVIELPALRSDDAVAFLAALGLVEVCTDGLGVDVRLGWDGVGGAARFESPFDSTGALASAVHALVCQWQSCGKVVPPPDPGFVTKRLTDADRRALAERLGAKPPNDPMRMTPELAMERFSRQQAAELAGDRVGGRWLPAMVAQLSVIDKAGTGGYCDLTPLYAPAGQQTLYQLYEKYTSMVVSSPRRIEEALSGWRRSTDDSGANLDYRDVHAAAASPTGVPQGAGVPGATWLALQSVPFFRLVGDGRHGSASGWVATGRGGRPRQLRWPVWRHLLDCCAIEVLLEHPATGQPTGRRRPANERFDAPGLEALGVVALLGARRRASGNSDGPLQRPEILWP